MKQYKLIANPAAGRGRSSAAILRVVELFKAQGACFDLELTTAPKQAAEIARAALGDFDVIVAVGGDGTVNEIVPALLWTGKPLGIIPVGSGNDLIKALGTPEEIRKAVDTVLRGSTRVIDAGRINDRYFVNGVGIGFDAAVNRESYEIDHSRRGLWLYLCALARMIGRFDPVPVTIACPSAFRRCCGTCRRSSGAPSTGRRDTPAWSGLHGSGSQAPVRFLCTWTARSSRRREMHWRSRSSRGR